MLLLLLLLFSLASDWRTWKFVSRYIKLWEFRQRLIFHFNFNCHPSTLCYRLNWNCVFFFFISIQYYRKCYVSNAHIFSVIRFIYFFLFNFPIQSNRVALTLLECCNIKWKLEKPCNQNSIGNGITKETTAISPSWVECSTHFRIFIKQQQQQNCFVTKCDAQYFGISSFFIIPCIWEWKSLFIHLFIILLSNRIGQFGVKQT